jgi:glycosyltransferase involved in cell wall biosynthesis
VTSLEERPMTGGSVTVVIPAFNEATRVGEVVKQIVCRGFDFVAEVLVVDDGSTDGTASVAQAAGARVISYGDNRGYGTALKTGIRAAKTPFILTMDADGQHRTEDIGRLWALAEGTDMVVGQRTALIHSPVWRMPGKWVLRALAAYLTRRSIPDLNSGLRVIRRDVAMRYLHLCPRGFSFSTTMTMALLTRGYGVRYVPIQVRQRTGKSMVSVATGFDTLVLALRISTLFNPLHLFVPASVFFGSIGILWGIPYALAGRGVSVGSMLAIVTALLLFSFGLISDQISQLRLERFE